MIIFAACPDDDESIEIAKRWIIDNGHTSETVRLYKCDGVVCVEKK